MLRLAGHVRGASRQRSVGILSSSTRATSASSAQSTSSHNSSSCRLRQPQHLQDVLVPSKTHIYAITFAGNDNSRRNLSSYSYTNSSASNTFYESNDHQVDSMESMRDKTHRLLDSSETPLGSFRASTCDDIIESVHYWTSPDRPPAARLRSAKIASRLVQRFTVEVAVNNLWANDMSWALAEMNASLRKVWVEVDGRDGAENAEAALRAEVEEYFNNPRCEHEPEVESFLSTASKWMSLKDGDDAALRAGGILIYLTECLEIGEKDQQQRQQIIDLFHDVCSSLEQSDSDQSKQLSVLEERMNQLRGEGWDGMGERLGERNVTTPDANDSIVGSTSNGATERSEDRPSPSSPLEDSLKQQFIDITTSADAASYKKVEAIYRRLVSMSDEPDSSFILDDATAQYFADYLTRTRPVDADSKPIRDLFGEESIPNGSSNNIGLDLLQLKEAKEYFKYINSLQIMNGDLMQIEKAEEALNEMVGIIKSTSYSDDDLNWTKRCFDVVAKAHRRVGDDSVVERVGKLIETMDEIGIKEKGFVTRTYLHAVALAKQQEKSTVSKAEEIFENFLASYRKDEAGADKPDAHMFLNMMEILVKERRSDMLARVLDLHDKMTEHGLRLDGSRHNYILIACAKGRIEDEEIRLRALRYITDSLNELQQDDGRNIDNSPKRIALSRMMTYGFIVHSLRRLLPGKDNAERRKSQIDSVFDCCCRDGVLSAKNIKVFKKERAGIKKEWSRNVNF